MIEYRENKLVSTLAAQYLSNLYRNVSLAELKQIQIILNPSSQNNIWTIMRRVQTVAKDISGALSMFDWDVFLPMESEIAMEKLFGDHRQQAQLNITHMVAGLVFDTDPPAAPGNTIKNATIKIRSNFSVVVNPSTVRDS